MKKRENYQIQANTEELNQINDIIRNKIAPGEEQAILIKFFDRLRPRQHSEKIIKATQKATEARTKRAKKKIDNAINILRMENKPITHYSISKIAEVSYNTVKKYVNLDTLKQINV